MSADRPTSNPQQALQGGAFLHLPVLSAPIFTPERFTAEQREYRDAAMKFMQHEVEPRVAELDSKAPGAMLDVMRKAAELGFLMAEVPEAYDGLGLDKVTSMLIAEAMSRVGSFAVTYGAHVNIGTLPLVYYGTPEQKRRYLPRLASGELIGAYCLSEPDSGSDALAAKTVAKLSADGKHYVLNGTKQWITNGAFAHLYTIFAQVDGEHFTAFLVERGTPGLSIGREEHKLGIRGSSTTQVILEDALVPVGNVLGDVGRGHKIAFNILNIGRWKLGSGSTGGAKYALSVGVRYAKERKQFKKPIATFGLVRKKLAEAAVLTYASESMAYRMSGMVDARMAMLDAAAPDYDKQAVRIIEDVTIEASVLKVFGSESMWRIADEMLQIHGGNGYVEDYPAERILRDARINLIFEGTNEINRLIIPATLFKSALAGRIPLMEYVGTLLGELAEPEKLPQKGEGLLANEIWATELVKRAVIYGASYAAQKYMDDLKEKQQLLGALADVVIDVYAMDSVVARAHQAATDAEPAQREHHRQLAAVFCFDARVRVLQTLRRIAMMMAEGEELDMLYANLGKLDQRYRVDYMRLVDEIAQRVIDDDGYRVSR